MKSLVTIAIALMAVSPFNAAYSQDVDPLGSGLPMTYTLAKLPANLSAVKVESGQESYVSILSVSMFYGRGTSNTPVKGSLPIEELMFLSSMVWVDANELSANSEYVRAYRFYMEPQLSGAPLRAEDLSFRLSYIRRASMTGFTFYGENNPDKLRVRLSNPSTSPLVTASAKTQTLSNLKQLGTGTLIMLSDFDDRFPYVQGTSQLFELIYPYTKSKDVTKSLNPAGSRVLFNMSLAGADIVQIDSIAEIPMFYEETPWADGTRYVCFADSHVKGVTAAEWERLKPKLKLNLKRYGKPLKPGELPPLVK